MPETDAPALFREPYILVRILGDHDDDHVDVEFEHSGFPDRDAAFGFLKAVVENSEEV